MAPSLKKTVLYVVLAHVFLILISSISWSVSSPSEAREQRLVVHTVALSTPKPSVVIQEKPKPKQVEKKKVATNDDKKKKLIQQAQEKIAKLDLKYDTVPPSTKPKTIAGLHIDSMALNEKEAGYVDEIAGVMQALLRLPEAGDVVIDLKLDRSGRVMKVNIVSSKNGRNTKYVESTLPDIQFPTFNGLFKDEKQHTFHITLSDIKL